MVGVKERSRCPWDLSRHVLLGVLLISGTTHDSYIILHESDAQVILKVHFPMPVGKTVQVAPEHKRNNSQAALVERQWLIVSLLTLPPGGNLDKKLLVKSSAEWARRNMGSKVNT